MIPIYVLTVQTAQVPQTTSHTITAQQFGNTVANSIMIGIQAIGNLVEPIAKLSLLVAIIAFIIGGVFHSQTMKRIGGGGIVTVLIGLLLYYAAPVILGLIQGMAQPFRTG